MKIKSDYPKQQFLFFIVSDFEEGETKELESLIETIATKREWIIGPPQFIDEIEEPDDPEMDEPIRTLGGVLEIYSAQPPHELPYEIDLAHFSEVKEIIDNLVDYTSKTGHEIEFELGGVHIGTIDGGETDELIEVGLLQEWGKGLESKIDK